MNVWDSGAYDTCLGTLGFGKSFCNNGPIKRDGTRQGVQI